MKCAIFFYAFIWCSLLRRDKERLERRNTISLIWSDREDGGRMRGREWVREGGRESATTQWKVELKRKEEDGESHVGGNYPMLKPHQIGWITQGGADFTACLSFFCSQIQDCRVSHGVSGAELLAFRKYAVSKFTKLLSYHQGTFIMIESPSTLQGMSSSGMNKHGFYTQATHLLHFLHHWQAGLSLCHSESKHSLPAAM